MTKHRIRLVEAQRVPFKAKPVYNRTYVHTRLEQLCMASSLKMCRRPPQWSQIHAISLRGVQGATWPQSFWWASSASSWTLPISPAYVHTLAHISAWRENLRPKTRVCCPMVCRCQVTVIWGVSRQILQCVMLKVSPPVRIRIGKKEVGEKSETKTAVTSTTAQCLQSISWYFLLSFCDFWAIYKSLKFKTSFKN